MPIEIIIPLVAIISGGIGYLLKRKFEQRKITENLEIDHKILDLKKKINDLNISEEEFYNLRQQFIDKRETTESFINQNKLEQKKRQEHRNSVDISNAELKSMTAQDVERVKLEVKIAINELLERSNEHQKPWLENAQKTWEDFIEKQAQFVGDAYYGGTHSGLAYLLELENQYWLRLAQLQAELKELRKFT